MGGWPRHLATPPHPTSQSPACCSNVQWHRSLDPAAAAGGPTDHMGGSSNIRPFTHCHTDTNWTEHYRRDVASGSVKLQAVIWEELLPFWQMGRGRILEGVWIKMLRLYSKQNDLIGKHGVQKMKTRSARLTPLDGDVDTFYMRDRVGVHKRHKFNYCPLGVFILLALDSNRSSHILFFSSFVYLFCPLDRFKKNACVWGK